MYRSINRCHGVTKMGVHCSNKQNEDYLPYCGIHRHFLNYYTEKYQSSEEENSDEESEEEDIHIVKLDPKFLNLKTLNKKIEHIKILNKNYYTKEKDDTHIIKLESNSSDLKPLNLKTLDEKIERMKQSISVINEKYYQGKDIDYPMACDNELKLL